MPLFLFTGHADIPVFRINMLNTVLFLVFEIFKE